MIRTRLTVCRGSARARLARRGITQGDDHDVLADAPEVAGSTIGGDADGGAGGLVVEGGVDVYGRVGGVCGAVGVRPRHAAGGGQEGLWGEGVDGDYGVVGGVCVA